MKQIVKFRSVCYIYKDERLDGKGIVSGDAGKIMSAWAEELW